MSERFFPRPFFPRSWKSCVFALVATLLLLGIDLGSKKWAIDHLSASRVGTQVDVCKPDRFGYSPTQRVLTEPVQVIPGLFELRYAENCGAAFGFLHSETSVGKSVLFFAAAVGCVLLLGFMFVTGRQGRAFAYAVPFVVAGAIGNLVDRIRFGYVVDFIHVHGESWSYPTFNVADVWISLGVALLLIDGVLETKLDQAAAKRQEEADRAAANAEEIADSDRELAAVAGTLVAAHVGSEEEPLEPTTEHARDD